MILCADPKAQYISYKEEIDQAIQDVLNGNRYVLGENVEALEENFSSYIGVKYSIGVANGTDAIEISLRSLNIGPGDKVITVAHSAVATVAGIEASGAIPVIVDLEENFYTLNPDLLNQALTSDVKAVVAVHIYGQSSAMNQLLSFCKENNLFLIEDCAQAHGAIYDGKRLGSIGDIGCFSCYPTKNLGAIGDAGLITTNSSSLAKKIRMIREYGWVDRISAIKGRNSRLDELQAAILNVKLKYLDKDNQKRNAIAEKYDSLLSDHMITPIRRPESNHVFHLYVCRLPNRNQLKKFLEEKNIFPGIHYPVPIHLQPAYHEKIELASPLQITEQIAHEILSLPMFPELSLENVDYIIETILLFYKDYKC